LHVLVPTVIGAIGVAALSYRFVESRFRGNSPSHTAVAMAGIRAVAAPELP
jgi:hypothetical protein